MVLWPRTPQLEILDTLFKIWGFHRGKDLSRGLMGCDTVLQLQGECYTASQPRWSQLLLDILFSEQWASQAYPFTLTWQCREWQETGGSNTLEPHYVILVKTESYDQIPPQTSYNVR